MPIKTTIDMFCPKCGVRQLSTDFIFQKCHKCAPPGPKSPPRRVNPDTINVNPKELALPERFKETQ